ncbi:MAG: hypothetical protein V1685_02625 [Parcubacteria group bacterium]
MADLIKLYNPESCHWYAQDGKPRHDATLTQAQKEGLLPSVTSVLSLKVNYGIQNWKLSQLLSQALTMTRLPDKSDKQFIRRVQEQDETERAKAPDLGSAVHRAIADYINYKTTINPEGVDIESVLDWIVRHLAFGKEGGYTEVSFASPFGYGGCIDYVGIVDGRSAIIDWKTQAVKGKPKFYDEWVWQLAAYQRGRGGGEGRAVWSVIIDTVSPGCYAKLWEHDDVERGWQGFRGLVAAWCAEKKYYPLETK